MDREVTSPPLGESFFSPGIPAEIWCHIKIEWKTFHLWRHNLKLSSVSPAALFTIRISYCRGPRKMWVSSYYYYLLDSSAKIAKGTLIFNCSRAFDVVNTSVFMITNVITLDIPSASVLTLGRPVPLRKQIPVFWKFASSSLRWKEWSGLVLVLIGVMGGAGRRHVGLIVSEWKQLWPSCFLHRFCIDETHQTSLCATQEVSLLFRYVLDLEFVTSPARFISTSRNTQPLWPQTTFIKSPQWSTLICTPLAPPSALVSSRSTISSSSPNSTFYLIASSPELR